MEVIPSDTVVYPVVRDHLWVGEAGSLTYVTPWGQKKIIPHAAADSSHYVQFIQVLKTGTTAQKITTKDFRLDAQLISPPNPSVVTTGDYAILINPWDLSYVGNTMTFYINDVPVHAITVTNEGNGDISAERINVIGRTDPTIEARAGFLDENDYDIEHDIAWEGPFLYVPIDPGLVVAGQNTARITITGDNGSPSADAEIKIMRVEKTGDTWNHAGGSPNQVPTFQDGNPSTIYILNATFGDNQGGPDWTFDI